MSAVERVMAAVKAHNSALPITRHVVDVKADGLLWRILREARREGCFVTVGPSEVSCDCAVVSIVGGCADGNTRESENLRNEMTALLNRHSRENVSNTPDFILADYLVGCLEAWDKTHNKLRVWQAQQFDESVPEPVVEWRHLQNGEIVEEGDEIFHLHEWYPVGKYGFPYEAGKTGAIRRRVETALGPITEHKFLDDSPYRPLMDGEFVEQGDEEHWDAMTGWVPVRSWGYYYGSRIHVPHRRRRAETLVHMDLQNGDLIWEDDEYLNLTSGNWERSSCYGEIYSYWPQYGGTLHRPHRRLFAKGYRWLRADDTVTNGDEILEDGKWSAIDETGAYDPVTMKPVRRKI